MFFRGVKYTFIGFFLNIFLQHIMIKISRPGKKKKKGNIIKKEIDGTAIRDVRNHFR